MVGKSRASLYEMCHWRRILGAIPWVRPATRLRGVRSLALARGRQRPFESGHQFVPPSAAGLTSRARMSASAKGLDGRLGLFEGVGAAHVTATLVDGDVTLIPQVPGRDDPYCRGDVIA